MRNKQSTENTNKLQPKKQKITTPIQQYINEFMINPFTPKTYKTVPSGTQSHNPSPSTLPIADLQSHILNLWTSYSVDETYQNLFLVYIETFTDRKQQIKAIQSEIKKTYEKNSLYFLLQENMILRAQIKQQIEQQLQKETQNSKIKKSSQKLQSVLKQLCDKLKNLRRINLLIAENILKIFEDFKVTRQSSLGSIGKKYIEIFMKIDVENEFIKQSFLNEYIIFQKGYDPFFLVHYQQIMKSPNPNALKKHQPVSQLFDMNISYVYRLMRAQQKMLKYMLLIHDHNGNEKERKEIINRQRMMKLSCNAVKQKSLPQSRGSNIFLPSISKHDRNTLTYNSSAASTIKPIIALKPRRPYQRKISQEKNNIDDSQCGESVRKKIYSLRPVNNDAMHSQQKNSGRSEYIRLKNQPRNHSLNVLRNAQAYLDSQRPQNNKKFQTQDEPLIKKRPNQRYAQQNTSQFSVEDEQIQLKRPYATSQSQKKWNIKQALKDRRHYLRPIKTRQTEQNEIIEEGQNQNSDQPTYFQGRNSLDSDYPMRTSVRKSKLADTQNEEKFNIKVYKLNNKKQEDQDKQKIFKQKEKNKIIKERNDQDYDYQPKSFRVKKGSKDKKRQQSDSQQKSSRQKKKDKIKQKLRQQKKQKQYQKKKNSRNQSDQSQISQLDQRKKNRKKKRVQSQSQQNYQSRQESQSEIEQKRKKKLKKNIKKKGTISSSLSQSQSQKSDSSQSKRNQQSRQKKKNKNLKDKYIKQKVGQKSKSDSKRRLRQPQIQEKKEKQRKKQDQRKQYRKKKTNESYQDQDENQQPSEYQEKPQQKQKQKNRAKSKDMGKQKRQRQKDRKGSSKGMLDYLQNKQQTTQKSVYIGDKKNNKQASAKAYQKTNQNKENKNHLQKQQDKIKEIEKKVADIADPYKKAIANQNNNSQPKSENNNINKANESKKEDNNNLSKQSQTIHNKENKKDENNGMNKVYQQKGGHMEATQNKDNTNNNLNNNNHNNNNLPTTNNTSKDGLNDKTINTNNNKEQNKNSNIISNNSKDGDNNKDNKLIPPSSSNTVNRNINQTDNNNNNPTTNNNTTNSNQPKTTQQQSKIKIVPGKVTFQQFSQYIKSKNIHPAYKQKFKSSLQFILMSAQKTQTYLNEFHLNDQLAIMALCSPTSLGNLVIYLWAPIENICDEKQSLFFFKKYLDYLQNQTTFRSIMYCGQEIPQLKNQSFQYQKDKNYLRKRVNPIKRQKFQFQYFFSMQATNINFVQQSLESLLYSDQITPFSQSNSWCNSLLLMGRKNSMTNNFKDSWEAIQAIKSINETNQMLERDSYDTFQVGQEKIKFQNINMTRCMLTQVPKYGFIANEGYMIVTGKALTLGETNKKVCKISLLNEVSLYFGSQFKTVEEMVTNLQKNKQKAKQQETKFAFKMFSKQLYGKYSVKDEKLQKNKAYYCNWDLNFAWRDQIPGKIIHDLNSIKHKYGSESFMLLIEMKGEFALGAQILRQDFLY